MLTHDEMTSENSGFSQVASSESPLICTTPWHAEAEFSTQVTTVLYKTPDVSK